MAKGGEGGRGRHGLGLGACLTCHAACPLPVCPVQAKALVAAHTGDRSALRNQRVVQRNLVYVIGLAPSIASEEVSQAAAPTPCNSCWHCLHGRGDSPP